MNIKRLFILIGTILLGITLVSVWLILFSGPPQTVRAASYTVCEAGSPTCDYDSIQIAVDAASDGDEIKVAGGTYTGINNQGGLAQVVYLDKSVTIKGGYTTTNWTTSDPVANPTTVDAERQGRVLYITGNISPTIDGLHITGGDATVLGSEEEGGGVFVQSAAAKFTHNQVFSNTAASGGGFNLDHSAATLSHNIIISNTSDSNGGGIDLYNSPATIIYNTISGNTADYPGGGGLNIYQSSATLIGNTVDSNIAAWGGGLHLTHSPATLTGNNIFSNTATEGGGGMFINSSGATLTNNLIFENQTDLFGSGLSIYLSVPHLVHNTITGNSGGDGSGINVSDSTVTLSNTIITNHVLGIHVDSVATASLESTLWGDGAWANGTDWAGDGTINTSNDLRGNPDFVDPNAGDYHIGPNSDAKNAGIDAGVTRDIDNQPRPYQEPDIGADEYWPPGLPIYIYLPLTTR